jgi:NAD-dependent dihydropyrimidine dehydrogenase PreA subunit
MNNALKWMAEKVKSSEKYWYRVVGTLLVLEILNVKLLGMAAPFRVPVLITVLLTAAGVYYAGILYLYLYDKYKNYLQTSKALLQEQISVLENHMVEIDESACIGCATCQGISDGNDGGYFTVEDVAKVQRPMWSD